MPTFSRGAVVRVPFPYTNARIAQHRPGLVVSNGEVGSGRLLIWVVMITSALHRPWPGDVVIHDYASAGLPAPSVVRSAKIASIEASLAAVLGQAPGEVIRAVDLEIDKVMGKPWD